MKNIYKTIYLTALTGMDRNHYLMAKFVTDYDRWSLAYLNFRRHYKIAKFTQKRI